MSKLEAGPSIALVLGIAMGVLQVGVLGVIGRTDSSAMEVSTQAVLISSTLLLLLLSDLTHAATLMLLGRLVLELGGGGVRFLDRTKVFTGTPNASICFNVRALIRELGTCRTSV